MCKKLFVLTSRVSNFLSVTRRPERTPSIIPTSRVLWLVAFAVVWTMTGYGGIAIGQVAGVDDPSDMADSSGDIKRIEAWVDEGNLNLTMTIYGVFAPSVEDTPAGMSNRYYYHWLLDTDNNPATGYLNNDYEGTPTNLETPIGVDVLVQFGWRDGATAGVYAYTQDPLTGDEVELFQDYEYTIDGDTIHAVIPLADLGLTPDDIIAVSAFQEGASNDWQVDWIESFELRLDDTSVSAYNPDPADGAYIAATYVSMSWSPDDAAATHDVYLGDNYDDVANGTGDTFRGNQGGTFYVAGFAGYPYPDGLIPGTTYYWRIDEVNEADPNSPWKGDVWSFSIPPRTAYNPDPADGAGFVDPNADLSWTAGYGAKTHTLYLGENYEDVNNAADGTSQVPATYDPSTLEREKVYYWRVDEFDAENTYKGDIWSFTTPGAVGNPSPANGAENAKMTTTLTWTPSDSAASHELYFGTDKDAVRNADKNSPEYKGPKTLGAESYDPGKLAWYATYYWRVDEVDNLSNSMKGPVWSLTTADFITVDDFEAYDTGDNQIWYAWHDGLGYGTPEAPPYSAGNGTGLAVGDETTPSYCEEKIFHGGKKSMPVLYDNNKQGFSKYSEVDMTLSEVRDWTEEGVGTMMIWFRGKSNNGAEPLYVAVSNSAGTPAIVVHDDPAAAQVEVWTKWEIPLQAFADQGIVLTDVDKIAIGLGTWGNITAPGGAGKMYFDDIRLDRPAEEPVSVENFSFELPGTEKIKGWNGEGVAGTPAVDIPGWSSDTEVVDSGVETGYTATDGEWTAFLMSGDPSVWQLTGHTISVGDVLELKVDAMITWAATTMQMTLYYDDNGARVPLVTNDVALTDDMQEFALSFSAADVPESVGHQIGIEFANVSSGDSWIGLDNVRLVP